MKKLMIALVVVLLALALGLGGFLAFMLVRGENPFTGRAQLANSMAYPAAAVEVLDVRYSSDPVTLVRTTGDEIVVEEYFTRWTDDLLGSASFSAGTFQVQGGQRHFTTGIWYASMRVLIPDGWNGTLIVNNSSGSIRSDDDFSLASVSLAANSGSVRVQGLAATGEVTLSTSSGSLRVGDVTTPGAVTLATLSGSLSGGRLEAATLEATASSGSVRIDEAVCGTVFMRSSSGTVQLGRVEGVFQLESSSGSVRVEGGAGHGSAKGSSGSVQVTLAEVTGDISLSANSGTVRLNIPTDTSFTFAASTTSGTIRTEFDGITINDKKNAASGTVGAGPYVHIELSASSGGVRLNG